MRRLGTVVLLLGVSVALAACSASGAHPAAPLIPRGTVKVGLHALMVSPRGVELAKRVEAAVAGHPDWWTDHVARGRKGEPLDYDARMGISEGEYREMLEHSQKMIFQQTGTADLGFEWQSESAVTLRGAGPLAKLDGIRVDLGADSVTTPFGVLTRRVDVDSDDAANPMGRWRGVQWELEKPREPGEDGVIAKLAVGRRTDDGRGLVYYSATRFAGGLTAANAFAFLLYDVPEPSE